MGILSEDTNPKVEAMQMEMLRHTPDWRKLQMVGELNLTIREMAMLGLRERYPLASAAELRRRLADILLGKNLAYLVYGVLPQEESHAI